MSTLQAFLHEHELQVETIIYLLNQGIEIERLKLEIQHCTDSDSIESHLKIINGERFAFLLRIGCAC